MIGSTTQFVTGTRSFMTTVVPGFALIVTLFGWVLKDHSNHVVELASTTMGVLVLLVASYLSGLILATFEELYNGMAMSPLRWLDRWINKRTKGACQIDYLHTEEGSSLFPIARERIAKAAGIKLSEVSYRDLWFLLGVRAAQDPAYSQVDSLVQRSRMLSRLSAVGVLFVIMQAIHFVLETTTVVGMICLGAACLTFLMLHVSSELKHAAKLKAWVIVVLCEPRSSVEDKVACVASPIQQRSEESIEPIQMTKAHG